MVENNIFTGVGSI